MQLEHAFTVPVGVKQAWDVLLDLPRIAPCLPGAALTEYREDGFAGTVKVKLGPINLTYRGTGRFVERDEEARRVVIEANGRDSRSAGTASATITATLHPSGDEETDVRVLTDLTVTGRPAQFGRGVLADVSAKLIGQFADCLAGKVRETGAAPAPAPAAAVAEGEPAEGRPPVSLAEVPTPAEVEAIDLLHVTGAAAWVRKAVPYLVAFGAGVVIAWLFAGRRRR
jgi:carbon monoxide dehydrogenase subunit G